MVAPRNEHLKYPFEAVVSLLSMAIQTVREGENVWGHLYAKLQHPGSAARFDTLLNGYKWWHLYELPFQKFTFRVFVRIGFMRNAMPAIDALAQNQPRTMADLVPFGDQMNLLTETAEFQPKNLPAAIAALMTLYRNQVCLIAFGETLNDLVRRAPESDKALMLAVRGDPAVIHCKNLAPRFLRAQRDRDPEFLREYSNALRNPAKIQIKQKPELDLCLIILQSMKQLALLTGPERVELFLDRLKVNKSASADPATLLAYIRRWEKRKDKLPSSFILGCTR